MLTRAPTPREILTEWARNRHGTRRTPFVAIQCFGLEVNEEMSDACCLGPADCAAGVGVRPSAPAATNMENE